MTAFDWLAIIIGPISGISIVSHIIISLTNFVIMLIGEVGVTIEHSLLEVLKAGRGPNWGCEWTCSSQSKSKEHP